jgi:hypothetical protein
MKERFHIIRISMLTVGMKSSNQITRPFRQLTGMIYHVVVSHLKKICCKLPEALIKVTALTLRSITELALLEALPLAYFP